MHETRVGAHFLPLSRDHDRPGFEDRKLMANDTSATTLSDETYRRLVSALTDEQAFNAVLNDLLRAAHENDIELDRIYSCRNNGIEPTWDVQITEVQRTQNPSK